MVSNHIHKRMKIKWTTNIINLLLKRVGKINICYDY